MHVTANTTPASAPGDFVWEDEEAIVEVPDALGTELLRIAGQFSEVLPTDPRHPHYVEPEPEEEPLEPVPEQQGWVEAPPRTGPNAGRPLWESYAASLGVKVPENLGRDAIIKLLEDEGKIEKQQ